MNKIYSFQLYNVFSVTCRLRNYCMAQIAIASDNITIIIYMFSIVAAKTTFIIKVRKMIRKTSPANIHTREIIPIIYSLYFFYSFLDYLPFLIVYFRIMSLIEIGNNN